MVTATSGRPERKAKVEARKVVSWLSGAEPLLTEPEDSEGPRAKRARTVHRRTAISTVFSRSTSSARRERSPELARTSWRLTELPASHLPADHAMDSDWLPLDGSRLLGRRAAEVSYWETLERVLVENPSQCWVHGVQRNLWSMVSENVGYSLHLPSCENAIGAYMELTGGRFVLEKQSLDFGKESTLLPLGLSCNLLKLSCYL